MHKVWGVAPRSLAPDASGPSTPCAPSKRHGLLYQQPIGGGAWEDEAKGIFILENVTGLLARLRVTGNEAEGFSVKLLGVGQAEEEEDEVLTDRDRVGQAVDRGDHVINYRGQRITVAEYPTTLRDRGGTGSCGCGDPGELVSGDVTITVA
jgi:hypothetical protein